MNKSDYLFKLKIAGRIDPDFKNDLEIIISKYPKIRFQSSKDEYLPEESFVDHILKSDIVWVGYQKKHFSSSAVAISCIGLKKPFIAFDNFFMSTIAGKNKSSCLLKYNSSIQRLTEELLNYLDLLGNFKNTEIDKSNKLFYKFSPTSFENSFLNLINRKNF